MSCNRQSWLEVGVRQVEIGMTWEMLEVLGSYITDRQAAVRGQKKAANDDKDRENF